MLKIHILSTLKSTSLDEIIQTQRMLNVEFINLKYVMHNPFLCPYKVLYFELKRKLSWAYYLIYFFYYIGFPRVFDNHLWSIFSQLE